jgi:hypothetical protein
MYFRGDGVPFEGDSALVPLFLGEEECENDDPGKGPGLELLDTLDSVREDNRPGLDVPALFTGEGSFEGAF